jgi:uncharacterized membrane protein
MNFMQLAMVASSIGLLLLGAACLVFVASSFVRAVFFPSKRNRYVQR